MAAGGQVWVVQEKFAELAPVWSTEVMQEQMRVDGEGAPTYQEECFEVRVLGNYLEKVLRCLYPLFEAVTEPI